MVGRPLITKTHDNKTDEVKEEPENSKLDDILNELTNSEEEFQKLFNLKFHQR